MTEYGLEPAFVKLDYASLFGVHTHIISTKEWLPTSITGAMGSYVNWALTPVDAEAMIDALVAVWAPLLATTTTVTQATIFTKADEASPAIPVAAKSLAVVGTSTLTGITKAVQATFNMRSSGVHPAKLVFLDIPHTTLDLNKQFPADWTTAQNDVFDVVSDNAWAWSARDNTQIMSKVSITWNLNQQLRKQYKMA